jgi:aldose 1-epimerase
MARTVFGLLDDGSAVERVRLSAHGLSLAVLTLGARIQELRLETARGAWPVVLGFGELDSYLSFGRYFGCVAGRCANRIRDGELRLEGAVYKLPLNEKGRTHLHGGVTGFSGRNWRITDATEESVALALTSPDGEEGYPGTLEVRCAYRLAPGRRVVIALEAESDRTTIVNLATHSVFNLDGGADILDHRLRIAAERYAVVDEALIPTGELRAVADTPFDFRQMRRIGLEAGGGSAGYDHNFCLADAPSVEPRFAARLEGPERGFALEVWSTEPGLQFYDGAYLDLPVAPSGARSGGRHAGLCLEPQRYPDAVHHPHFPSVELRPNVVYRQVTEYRLSEDRSSRGG